MKTKIRSTVAPVFKIKLKKGDTVMVRAGKYKGKTGVILSTHPTENKVTVEGINVFKKHMKPNKQYPQGGIIDITKPIWVGKLGILEPNAKKASRISHIVDSKGVKKRVFTSNQREIK